MPSVIENAMCSKLTAVYARKTRSKHAAYEYQYKIPEEDSESLIVFNHWRVQLFFSQFRFKLEICVIISRFVEWADMHRK